MTVAAVTYMYESENQLEDFDPIRFLTIGNNDKPVGGAFPENIIPLEERRNDTIRTQYHEDANNYIYTFFSPLTTMTAGMTSNSHNKLLKAWEEAWQNAGWKTKVLTIEDAKIHKDFDLFNRVIAKNFPQTSEYDRLCFLRWLAMSTVGGGFMADYDTFPLEMKAQEYINLPNDGNFTGFDRFVPALASGSAEEWDRMAHELLNAILSPDYSYFVHDMYALLYIRDNSPETLIFKGDVFSSIFYDISGKVDCSRLEGKKAIHFSHAAIAETVKSGGVVGFNGNNIGEAIEQRWKISQDFISKWRMKCHD